MLKNKTFRNYKEQIEFMQSRGIRVPDQEAAIEALSTFSYYSLVNLNKHLYGGLDKRDFEGSPSILDLQLAHMLNMNFYHILLKGILYVEAAFKTKLAYLISREFGTEAHDDLDRKGNNYFHQAYYDAANPSVPGTLRTLRNKLRFLLSDTKANSYSHKFLAGNRQLPPWMFVHDIEFGLAVLWYNILQQADRAEVRDRMMWGETGQPPAGLPAQAAADFFESALEILREYRNTIAHGERVFPVEMTAVLPWQPLKAVLPEGILSLEEYQAGFGQKDTFACLLAVVYFIHDPVLMVSFLREIRAQIEFAQQIRQAMAPGALDIFQILGIPPFTMERLIRLSHLRFGSLTETFLDRA